MRGKPGSGRKKGTGRVPVEPVVVEIPRLAIVPPELWDRVQATMKPDPKLRAITARRAHGSNIRYLTTGMAICDRCGDRLRLVSSRNGYSYIGCWREVEQPNQCPGNTYAMHALERVVVRGLRDIVLDPANIERFALQAKDAVDRRRKDVRVQRNNLEKQADKIRITLDNAVKATFRHPRLNDRRVAELERMEDELAQVEDRIAALADPVVATLSAGSLPNLCEMFDELEMRAPFVATDANEIAVHATLRRLLSSIRVRRLDRVTVQVIVSYDLGPIIGIDAPEVKVEKTFRYDLAEERRIGLLKRKQWIRAIVPTAFDLTPEQLEALTDFPSFHQLFADTTLESRTIAVRALLLMGSLGAKLDTLRSLLTTDDVTLWERVDEFRSSDCIIDFVATAHRLFPRTRLTYQALTFRPVRTAKILATIDEVDRRFLDLDMCRPGSGVTSLRDDHWRAVAATELVHIRGRRTTPWDDRKKTASLRRALEALAAIFRDGLDTATAARTRGLTASHLSMLYRVLQTDNAIGSISAMLHDLAAADRR